MGKTLVADRPGRTAAPAAPGRVGRATSPWENRRTLGILAALMLAAGAVRLYRLTALGLWEDEGWSALVAPLSLPNLFRWCGGDTSPPLYYLLLHLCTVFGSSDVVLRMPSVVFGVLTLPVIYLCGRAAHSARAGLIAAALLAVNTFHVRYSQEARFYAFYLFLALWAVYFTLELARRPSWGRWIGWVIAATCLLYVHSTAAVYVLALSALLVALRRDLRHPLWRGWLAAHGVLVALFLPWSAVQAQQMARVVHDFWPPTPTPDTLAVTAVQMFSVPFIGHEGGPVDLPLVAIALALPYGICAAMMLVRLRHTPRGSAVAGLLLFALTAWGLVFAFSVAVRSVYILRILIPSMGALILVIAIALADAERVGQVRGARVLLGLMLLSGCLSLGLYFRHYQKQDIRGAAQYLLRHAQQEEAFACVENRFRPALEHYLKGGPLQPCPLSLGQFTLPGRAELEATRQQLAADLGSFSSFWLVEIDDAHSRALNHATEAWLNTLLQPAGAESFYAVRVVHYRPRAGRLKGSASSPPPSPAARAER
jgi:4-amino-4-deoxy-L-arabinose transferase-like glycosyltransferase